MKITQECQVGFSKANSEAGGECSLQIVGVDMIRLSSSERRPDKNACLELHVLISLEKHGWPSRQQYSG